MTTGTKPRHFIESGGWEKFKAMLLAGRPLILFSDFDGTLVPIRQVPWDVEVPEDLARFFEFFSSREDMLPCIVTGRPMSDIKTLFGLAGIMYVANHGLHVACPEYDWVHPEKEKIEASLNFVMERLGPDLEPFPNIFMEFKGLTLGVHHRLEEEESAVRKTKKAIDSILKESSYPLRVMEGKKVFEIRPALDWDKGKGVLAVLGMSQYEEEPLCIYIGDDRTDEDAFKALRDSGVTVKVGRNARTLAEYYLDSPSEVVEMLGRIKAALEEKDSGF
jgi:trehalose 6-phosphate phosphatase